MHILLNVTNLIFFAGVYLKILLTMNMKFMDGIELNSMNFVKNLVFYLSFLNFLKKKWGECEKIAGSKRHKSWHPIEYDGFQGKDRRYLEKKYGDKISVFYQISLSGRERIIGYKDIDIFYPIWYDENHEVLPTKK